MQPQDGYSCSSLNPRCRVHKYRRDIDKQKSISKRLNFATMVHVNKCIEMSTKLAVQIWTKKTYCLGETLHTGGGDCVLLWGGRRGDISMTYHCRYSSDTTPRSTALSVQQQHQDLSVHLYRNNTPVSVQLLYMWIQYWLWSCQDEEWVQNLSPPSLTATLLNGRLLWPMDRKMTRQTSHCYIH